MPYKVPLDPYQRFQNAAWGAQDRLVIISVPSAAAHGLIGQPLFGQTLTVAGDYQCLIPLAGLTTNLQVYTRATFASGGVTTAGPDSLYYVADPKAGGTFTVKTAGTGDGALVTATIQASTLGTFNGEQFALFTITVDASTSAEFTMAEYNGI